jgi:hypothetical protein
MSIGFDSDKIILDKLRVRLHRMTDEELLKFAREVHKLAENPFPRQLDEARAEWKRRKKRPGRTGHSDCSFHSQIRNALKGAPDLSAASSHLICW